MGKRANNQASKAAMKKTKIDPALAVVVDAVKKASHLPEQCSAMLASMLPFTLAIPSEDRLESQERVVGMVEETLQTVKSEMQVVVASEDAKLDTLKVTMAALLSTVKEAEGTLAVQKEAVQTANASLADATAAANATLEILTERQSEQTTSETNLASIEEAKIALENAFQVHFQTPMEAGEGPHHKELEPFLQNMEIETSMHSTLPGTCAKSKEHRGSFDDVILEQLEKAIAAKIATLAETASTETGAVVALAAATKEVETEYNSKKEVQNEAAAELERVELEQRYAEAALVEANEAVSEFRPQLESATGSSESAKARLVGFENGPFANFTTYKIKTAFSEAAPLGA